MRSVKKRFILLAGLVCLAALTLAADRPDKEGTASHEPTWERDFQTAQKIAARSTNMAT